MTYIHFFQEYVQKLKIGSSGQATGLCPLHEDRTPSFSCNIEEGLWKCHGCEKSGNVFQLAELLKTDPPTNLHSQSTLLQEITRYTYEDESGNPLFQVRRYYPKTFRLFRYDPKGDWIAGLNGISSVLYKLPQILKYPTAYIVEGEKDVQTLWSLGFPATCNPMGAGKWREEYSEFLRNKSVVIIPDNDEVGKNHANDVAKKLWRVAQAIKIVRLPQGKDVSEWKELGGTKEELTRLVQATSILTQPPQRSATSLSFQDQKDSSPQKLQLVTLKDLLAEPEEKTNWITEGLLPQGGLSLIVAKPKTGKSTIARQLALAVSKGEPFLERTTTKGLVLYLALEERRGDVRAHFKSMGSSGDEDLKIFVGMAPSDALEQVRQIAEVERPLLIIVDTLVRLTRIKDLNDYSQVISGLQPLLAIAREVGSHVCLLHHSKKGDSKGIDSALGSIGIVGTVDTIIEMNRSEKYRTIASIQRSGEDLPETILNFDFETKISSLGGSREQAEIDCSKKAILEFLDQQSESVTESAINEGVEGKTIYKRKALRELVGENKILRSGKGGKSSPYLYSVSSQNACSLVPTIYGEQGNKNLKTELSSENHNSYSCSQNLKLFDSCSQNQNQNSPSPEEKTSKETKGFTPVQFGGCLDDF